MISAWLAPGCSVSSSTIREALTDSVNYFAANIHFHALPSSVEHNSLPCCHWAWPYDFLWPIKYQQRPLKVSLSLTWLFCALAICHEKNLSSSGCASDLGPRTDKYRTDVSSACNLQTRMTHSFPAKISWATADLQNFLWGTYTFGGVLFHFVLFVLWSTEGANSWLLCYLKSSSCCSSLMSFLFFLALRTLWNCQFYVFLLLSRFSFWKVGVLPLLHRESRCLPQRRHSTNICWANYWRIDWSILKRKK